MFPEDRLLRDLLHGAEWWVHDRTGGRRLRPIVPPGDLVHGKVAHWNLVQPTGGFTCGPDGLLTDQRHIFVVEAKRADAPLRERRTAVYEAWGYAKQLAALLRPVSPQFFVSGRRASGVPVAQVIEAVEPELADLVVVPTLVELGDPSRLKFEEAAVTLAKGVVPVPARRLKAKWQCALDWSTSPAEFRWAAADAVKVASERVDLKLFSES